MREPALAGPWLKMAYDFFAAIMTRRFAHETFHGKPVLNLPPLREEKVACRSPRTSEPAFRNKAQILQQQWRAELAEKRRSAAHVGDALYRACSYSKAFHHTLFLASLPGLVDLPSPLSQNVEWLLSTNLKSANLSSWEAIQQHPAYRYIDTITSGSGKIKELRRILEIARKDRSAPNDDVPVALQKHVVVFASRPGVALIIAAYIHKNLSTDWNVQLILGSNVSAGERQKIIDNMFPDIPAGSNHVTPALRPGLLVTTAGACGTGMNGMEKASYGVVFDLPFSESHVKQAKGRIYRAKQRHSSHFYVLWSVDSEAEDLIYQRHCNPEQAFRSILAVSET